MSESLKMTVPALLKENPYLKVLEIGCGSGFQLETLSSSGVGKENLLGADINREAVEYCQNLGFIVVESNLFSNV